MNYHVTPSGQAVDSALRIKVVCKMLGLSRSTIYGKLNPNSSQFDSCFPKPFKIGTTAVAWSQIEVSDWLQKRKEIGTN